MAEAELSTRLHVLLPGDDSRKRMTVQMARELGVEVPSELNDDSEITVWPGNAAESPLIRSLISEIVTQAHVKYEVDTEKVRLLDEVGLLRTTTEFRTYEGFPGETSMFEYELSNHGLKIFGRLGFDIDLKLITIELVINTDSAPDLQLRMQPLVLQMYRSPQEGWCQLRS